MKISEIDMANMKEAAKTPLIEKMIEDLKKEFGENSIKIISMSLEGPYDFKILVKDIPFYGQIYTWCEYADEIIELLRKQLKTCPTSSSVSSEQ